MMGGRAIHRCTLWLLDLPDRLLRMQGGDTHDYLAENVTCECGFARVTFRNLVANHTSHGANMKAVGQGVGTISDIVFDS